MTVEGKTKKDTLIAKLEGKIDTETAPELERFFDENLNGIRNVELDMKKVSYISSAGLRVLLILKKKLGADREDCITAKNVNDTVKTVFEVTGFDDVVRIK